MKRIYSVVIMAAMVAVGLQASAQKRYVDEVFTDADIEVNAGVTFATNIDFLTSKLTDPARIFQDLTAIKTALATSQPIPASHYNPLDTSTKVKVTDIKMDIYYPKTSADTVSARPVIIFLHSGNFLPPGLNGSPIGFRYDSSAIHLCRQWAKRGYVAVSADYRLGWNPLATTVQERRGQLMNAVYRAIHDVKRCVIYLRADAAATNMYKIDGSKIALYGEGTGAYVANAYTTLDKYPEMELQKFKNPISGKSYVDTAQVGRIDGSGGALNLYPSSSISSDVMVTVAAGGALADTSWLEQGDAPMIAIQCIRDPFAPFDEGTVIVPTTNEDVVDVQGANAYIDKAVKLGNNDVFKNMPNDDAITKLARDKYGMTFDYIFPAPRNTITVKQNLEGLYAMDIAAAASLLQNQGAPWQWWDPNSAVAKTEVAPGVTAHMAALQTNPDMSRTKGLTYIDTIQRYILPRIAITMGFYSTADFVSVNDLQSINTAVYPNPSNGQMIVQTESGNQLERIELVDMSGRVMQTVEAQSNVLALDASSLTDGIYILRVFTSNGFGSKRVNIVH